jgi:hypothetical protein
VGRAGTVQPVVFCLFGLLFFFLFGCGLTSHMTGRAGEAADEEHTRRLPIGLDSSARARPSGASFVICLGVKKSQAWLGAGRWTADGT